VGFDGGMDDGAGSAARTGTVDHGVSLPRRGRVHARGSPSPTLASTSPYAISPGLRAQAQALYAPVARYERSTTPAERARVASAGRHLDKVLDTCQAPYIHRLLTIRNQRLYYLWGDATLLESQQVETGPVAVQLTRLAPAWATMSLKNRAMNVFVHGLAAELRATLDARPLDGCAFIKAIAAHHYSYTWAKQSAAGIEALRWWNQTTRASDRTAAFAAYTGNTGEPPPAGPCPYLFTAKQLRILFDVPGELS
jgi:hypothetical protein